MNDDLGLVDNEVAPFALPSSDRLADLRSLLMGAITEIDEHPRAPLPAPDHYTTHLRGESNNWMAGAMWQLKAFGRPGIPDGDWNVQVPDEGSGRETRMVYVHTPSCSFPSDVVAMYPGEARRLALMLLAGARRAEAELVARRASPMPGRQG